MTTKYPPGFSPKRSRTGVPGVQLVLALGRQVFLAECGRGRRQFSVARFGREEAFRAAVAVRAAFEEKFGVKLERSPETIARARASALAAWADPAKRARKVRGIRAAQARRTTAERRATARLAMNQPEVLARSSAAAAARWAKEAACR